MANDIDGGNGSGDIQRATTEARARLTALGIALDGSESAEDLVKIEDAVERFEEIVKQRGGDLMVDEGLRGAALQPDDRHFALPLRRAHEPVATYLGRLASAIDEVRHHRAL